MMLHTPGVLTQQQVAEFRRALEGASWVDGSKTAGSQATQVKKNLQLSASSSVSEELGVHVLRALKAHPLFVSSVLPKHILPPLFNCYQGGGQYGNHVDNALRNDVLNDVQVRTDVSTTLFLSNPEEYEGGELVIEDVYGVHEVKLPAGDAIIYPATSLHRVEPVTQGVRLASCLWTQSLVRDDWRRTMLFNLDMTIIKLRQQLGDTAEVVALTSHYHNLLRQWIEA
ncbi:MAG: Fe2+-dependent dioxygenase [Pseudomonadota bacterium]